MKKTALILSVIILLTTTLIGCNKKGNSISYKKSQSNVVDSNADSKDSNKETVNNGKKVKMWLVTKVIDNESGEYSKLKYDANGNIIEKEMYSSYNTLRKTRKYSYDKNNNIIKETYFDEDGKTVRIEEYVYKNNGRNIRKNIYNGKGKIKEDYDTYKYDENGNLLELKECYEDECTYKETFTYDKNGNLLEVKTWDGDNEVWEKYTYDENGKIIKIDEKYYDGLYDYVLKYDENGFLNTVNLHYEGDEISDDLIMYKYDLYGNIIERKYENGSTRSSAYIYDENKNIVRETIYSNGATIRNDMSYEYTEVEVYESRVELLKDQQRKSMYKMYDVYTLLSPPSEYIRSYNNIFIDGDIFIFTL